MRRDSHLCKTNIKNSNIENIEVFAKRRSRSAAGRRDEVFKRKVMGRKLLDFIPTFSTSRSTMTAHLNKNAPVWRASTIQLLVLRDLDTNESMIPMSHDFSDYQRFRLHC